jgi:soluble lytic murein transglycosylase-like protein
LARTDRRLQLNSYLMEISDAATLYGVPEALLRAVIHAESAFRPSAISHANAQGLMQLIPATAERFGVTNPWDPAQNIGGGAQYLAWLLRYFQGDLVKALAGYNAGEGAVVRHGGVPPYRETQAYVVRVQQLYAAYQQALSGGITLVNLPVLPYGTPETC